MIKASATLAWVATNITDITADEVARCSKVWDYQTKEYFYMVLSKTDDATEHKVTYDKEHGFGCTCKSAKYKWHNVKHGSGVCWHVRASIASSIEDRKALALRANEDRRQIEEQAGKSVEPIEVRWNIPVWMLRAPVAPHMKHSPREL